VNRASHMSVTPRTDGKLDRMVKVRRVGHPSNKTEQVLRSRTEQSGSTKVRNVNVSNFYI
jgi:hypothetical protein